MRLNKPTHVDKRRLEHGTEPDDIDTEVLQVVQLGNDALQITNPVLSVIVKRMSVDEVGWPGHRGIAYPVGIAEARRIDLWSDQR
jgi:hypothetical protein